MLGSVGGATETRDDLNSRFTLYAWFATLCFIFIRIGCVDSWTMLCGCLTRRKQCIDLHQGCEYQNKVSTPIRILTCSKLILNYAESLTTHISMIMQVKVCENKHRQCVPDSGQICLVYDSLSHTNPYGFCWFVNYVLWLFDPT